jgi:hypothetical protein
MWQYSKCGKDFKNTNQDHYCGRIKILLLLILASALLFTLTGCLSLNDDASPDNASNSDVVVMEPQPASPADNNDGEVSGTGVTLQICLGTDAVLSQYESFADSFYEDEVDGEWLVISTDTPVTDFSYIKVGYHIVEDDVLYYSENAVHHVGAFSPEKPFVIKTYAHWGTIPQYGVSFIDVDNSERYFYIAESGKDGELLIIEFINTPYEENNMTNTDILKTNNETIIEITVNGVVFTAKLYDNTATQVLIENLPMTLDMTDLHSNEKYHYLPYKLPTEAERVGNISAGNIMLYGSDCLVLFYESFSTSYSYTRLGHIENSDGLKDTLGSGNVQVTFAIKR